jgi:hypothetical protein
MSGQTQREAQYWRDRLTGLTDQQLVAWIRARVRDKAKAQASAEEVQSVWILGSWIDSPETDANWEVAGVFTTRQEALGAQLSNEFIARLPMGRAPDELIEFPDSAWSSPT